MPHDIHKDSVGVYVKLPVPREDCIPVDARQGEETFNQFLDRVGLEELTGVAEKAEKSAQEAAPNSDLYIDWERTNIYKLERGEGECMV